MNGNRIAAAAMCAAALALTATTAHADDYYKGRTLTFIVGYSAGGPTDTIWRTIVPYIQKHIPGNPEIVVQNRAGGGGMVATNFVYERARPDGLTVLTSPLNPIGAVTGLPGLRANYAEMRFIGGGAQSRVTYIRTGVLEGGLQDRADIAKLDSLKLGGLRPDSQLDLVGRLSLELLGLDLTYISGYRGSADYRVAVGSGEIDAATTGVASFRTFVEPNMVEAGEAMGLYYHPVVTADGAVEKDPSITDMPDFVSFYEELKGAPPSGPTWELLKWVYLVTSQVTQSMLAPPDTPDEAVDALRAGWDGLMQDEAYVAEATKRFGSPLILVSHEVGTRMLQSLDKTDPELVERLKAFIEAGAS